LEGHFQGKHLMLVEITKVVKHLHTKVIWLRVHTCEYEQEITNSTVWFSQLYKKLT
jgi:hypothetical protein